MYMLNVYIFNQPSPVDFIAYLLFDLFNLNNLFSSGSQKL